MFCEPPDALYQRVKLTADRPVLELVGAKISALRTPADELTRIQVSSASTAVLDHKNHKLAVT